MSEQILRIKLMNTSRNIALRWMPQNTFDDKSILVLIMAMCPNPMLAEIYIDFSLQ